MLEVSGLVGLRQSIDAGEYPGALVAPVRHQVSCMMMMSVTLNPERVACNLIVASSVELIEVLTGPKIMAK